MLINFQMPGFKPVRAFSQGQQLPVRPKEQIQTFFKTLISLCFFLHAALIIPTAFAQNEEEGEEEEELFNELIFDPVLIQISQLDDTTTTVELSSPPNPQPPPVLVSPPSYLVNSEAAPLEQESSSISLELAIDQYQQSVISLELEGGPYEERLSQEFQSLGNLYQEQGDHELALDTFSQALHVNRLNNGLFNLSQEPIIREIIQSQIALGDIAAADAQQQYLLYLERKVHGPASPALLPALIDYANWNILAFSIPLGALPAAFATEVSTFPEINFASPTDFQAFLFTRLLNAQSIYLSVVQILQRNFGPEDPRLLVVEQQLAMVNYYYATNYGAGYSTYYERDPRAIQTSMGFRYGRQALERRVEYLKNTENISPGELAIAIRELGDWLLLFTKRSTALKHYEEARQSLLADEISESRINEFFHPNLPTSIPAFLTSRYSRAANNIPNDMALDYQGYIDVEFTVNGYGQTGTINVLNESNDEAIDLEIKSILVTQLRRARFRPRISEGDPVKDDAYKIRYYYHY